MASSPRIVAAAARARQRGRARAAPARGLRLSLLDAFELSSGGLPIALPLSPQRLLAFVALQERPVLRAYIAGTLWPETSDARAHASLRSTLWRLRRAGCRLLEAAGNHLCLAPFVEVDLRDATALARRLLDPAASLEEVSAGLESGSLASDVLPDWYDDWVSLEREQFRQLRLHALEAACERLMRAGRFGEAAEAGLAALAGDPLRESAHRALIRMHLAEGNRGEAVRQYRSCRTLLRERLGLAPSAQTETLVRGLRAW